MWVGAHIYKANSVLGLLRRNTKWTEIYYILFNGKVNTWICKCSMAPLLKQGH